MDEYYAKLYCYQGRRGDFYVNNITEKRINTIMTKAKKLGEKPKHYDWLGNEDEAFSMIVIKNPKSTHSQLTKIGFEAVDEEQVKWALQGEPM